MKRRALFAVPVLLLLAGALTGSSAPAADPSPRVAMTASAVPDVERQTLKSTPNHPYYVVDRGWVAAEDLRPGDRLVTPHR